MSQEPEKSRVLDEFSCPLTGDPCKAGRPAECDHFWRCVGDALDRQLKKADAGPDQQASNAASG